MAFKFKINEVVIPTVDIPRANVLCEFSSDFIVEGISADGNLYTIVNEWSRHTLHEDNLRSANFYGTVSHFDSILSMYKFMETFEANPINAQFSSWLSELKRDTEGFIRENKTQWLGTPMPASLKDINDRDSFMHMDTFERLREEKIDPFKKDLALNSYADLMVNRLVPNDREIGAFDFDRASIGLVPDFKFWSRIHKAIVEPNETEAVLDSDGKYRTVLVSDKSPVIMIPTPPDDLSAEEIDKIAQRISDGEDALDVFGELNVPISNYSSTNKKSYQWFEKKPKMNKAVRIFVYVGGTANRTQEEILYNGIAGVALAMLLEGMGYSVEIIGYSAFTSDDLNNRGTTQNGVRTISFGLKTFSENYHIPSILYSLCDATFFRYKIFQMFIWANARHGDSGGYGIGSWKLPSQRALRSSIYKHFLPKDKNSGVFYLFMDGIFSEAQLSTTIRQMIDCIEEENRIMRDRQRGIVKK